MHMMLMLSPIQEFASAALLNLKNMVMLVWQQSGTEQ